VEPDLPRGREAREAWRALSPQARAAAVDAARQGVAPPDIGIAWAAAGYGRLMARRMRVGRALTPLAFLVLAVPASAAVILLRASVLATQLVIVALGVAVIAGLVPLTVRAGRYQRLYSSGLLGLQAARLGAPTGQPSPAVWRAAQSEFTVPYQARVPVAEPVPRPPADPAAAGTREIPARLGAIIRLIVVLAGIGVVLWLGALGELLAARGGLSGALPLIVVALGVTALTGYLLFLVWPALRHPVLARFSPDGWQLPSSGLAGSWSDIREIRVRPFAVRGPAAASPQLATYRIVVLTLDDPQAQLARLPSVRRRLYRRTMKRYGSPAVIVATPRRSIQLAELVPLLQRYTDAPVTWS
jgi:hypothetical protein